MKVGKKIILSEQQLLRNIFDNRSELDLFLEILMNCVNNAVVVRRRCRRLADNLASIPHEGLEKVFAKLIEDIGDRRFWELLEIPASKVKRRTKRAPPIKEEDLQKFVRFAAAFRAWDEAELLAHIVDPHLRQNWSMAELLALDPELENSRFRNRMQINLIDRMAEATSIRAFQVRFAYSQLPEEAFDKFHAASAADRGLGEHESRSVRAYGRMCRSFQLDDNPGKLAVGMAYSGFNRFVEGEGPYRKFDPLDRTDTVRSLRDDLIIGKKLELSLLDDRKDGPGIAAMRAFAAYDVVLVVDNKLLMLVSRGQTVRHFIDRGCDPRANALLDEYLTRLRSVFDQPTCHEPGQRGIVRYLDGLREEEMAVRQTIQQEIRSRGEYRHNTETPQRRRDGAPRTGRVNS